MPGFADELSSELFSAAASTPTVKYPTRELHAVGQQGNAWDAELTTWFGGAVLALTPQLHWISRIEYCETGEAIVHSKCQTGP